MYTGIIVIILLIVIWLGCAPKSASFTPGSLNQMRLNAGHAIKKALGVEKMDQNLSYWSGNSGSVKQHFASPPWSGNTAREHYEDSVYFAGNTKSIAGKEQYSTKLAHANTEHAGGMSGWANANTPSGLNIGKGTSVGQGTLWSGYM